MARIELAYSNNDHALNASGICDSAKLCYLVFEAADEKSAVEAVYNHTPARYSGVPLELVEIEERLAENIFKVSAAYRSTSSSQAAASADEEPAFSFDTGGGTQHITQSLETVGRYPASAPDLNGAIGYDGQSVAGVEITMPVMNFSETRYLKNSKVTTAYKARVAECTGRINNAKFKGYGKGEVLFLGASGAKRGSSSDDLWEITFKFAVSPNRKDIRLGGITVPSKYGWDYLWVRYADNVGNDVLVKRPCAAYCERVYEFADFGKLGLGR